MENCTISSAGSLRLWKSDRPGAQRIIAIGNGSDLPDFTVYHLRHANRICSFCAATWLSKTLRELKSQIASYQYYCLLLRN